MKYIIIATTTHEDSAPIVQLKYGAVQYKEVESHLQATSMCCQ